MRRNGMHRRRHGLLALLVAAVAVFVSPAGALADGKLQQPRTVSELGTVNGIAYRSYSGFFVGKTSTGNYRVPYELTGPVQPALGNGTVLVEVPHFAAGTAVRDLALGRHFVFGGRFSYGAVGWSTATSAGEVTNRILDLSARGVFIHGGAPLPGEDGQADRRFRARRRPVRARPPDHDGPTVRSPGRACGRPVSRQGDNARFRVREVLREGRGGSRRH